jgi:hypothetical protein
MFFTKLPLLLEELDPNTRTRQQRMWFQQDRAPPQFYKHLYRVHVPITFGHPEVRT